MSNFGGKFVSYGRKLAGQNCEEITWLGMRVCEHCKVPIRRTVHEPFLCLVAVAQEDRIFRLVCFQANL